MKLYGCIIESVFKEEGEEDKEMPFGRGLLYLVTVSLFDIYNEKGGSGEEKGECGGRGRGSGEKGRSIGIEDVIQLYSP